jgi:hypothetical protein
MTYLILISHLCLIQVRLCWGFLDSLCMDCAEVSKACICSNRLCPCCWCPDPRLDVTDKRFTSSRPTLYVGQVSNVLGRVPLIPLFFPQQRYAKDPYELRKHQRNQFPYCSTDTAQESGSRGSNVYELNARLWQFGRCKPRGGGLSVADTEDKRIALLQDGARRGHATRTTRKHKAAARNACCSGE